MLRFFCQGVSEVFLPGAASSWEDHVESAGSPRLSVLRQSHRPERPATAGRAGADCFLCKLLLHTAHRFSLLKTPLTFSTECSLKVSALDIVFFESGQCGPMTEFTKTAWTAWIKQLLRVFFLPLCCFYYRCTASCHGEDSLVTPMRLMTTVHTLAYPPLMKFWGGKHMNLRLRRMMSTAFSKYVMFWFALFELLA